MFGGPARQAYRIAASPANFTVTVLKRMKDTTNSPIVRETVFFPDLGGPSFSHAAEASGERKHEGYEQPVVHTRRVGGGSRFEPVSNHVPWVGHDVGSFVSPADGLLPPPTAQTADPLLDFGFFHFYGFYSVATL